MRICESYWCGIHYKRDDLKFLSDGKLQLIKNKMQFCKTTSKGRRDNSSSFFLIHHLIKYFGCVFHDCFTSQMASSFHNFNMYFSTVKSTDLFFSPHKQMVLFKISSGQFCFWLLSYFSNKQFLIISLSEWSKQSHRTEIPNGRPKDEDCADLSVNMQNV